MERRNTHEFMHFKLQSDSTLKSMTKEELISYIHVLYHNWQATDESYNNVMDVAKKLSDNPPLSFDDLKEGMWVWDNKRKCYEKVYNKQFNRSKKVLHIIDIGWGTVLFRENRFYRRQKED